MLKKYSKTPDLPCPRPSPLQGILTQDVRTENFFLVGIFFTLIVLSSEAVAKMSLVFGLNFAWKKTESFSTLDGGGGPISKGGGHSGARLNVLRKHS